MSETGAERPGSRGRPTCAPARVTPRPPRVHPMVTIPSAAATARPATPPEATPRPRRFVPSVYTPAPRRAISLPRRRAPPRKRRHSAFHPADRLPRDRMAYHRRPGLPRAEPSRFHHAERRPATEPSGLPSGWTTDRNDRRNRAAAKRPQLQNRRRRPLRFTAWFGLSS